MEPAPTLASGMGLGLGPGVGTSGNGHQQQQHQQQEQGGVTLKGLGPGSDSNLLRRRTNRSPPLVDVAPLFLQALLGAYFGWLYLRFLQRAADGMRGDMSDHMAFIMFFPPALQ